MNTDFGLPAYTLVRSRRRRSVAIIVDHERGVVVYAPERLGESKLALLVQARAAWIRAKLAVVARRRPAAREYRPGEQFQFLGEFYGLKVESGARPEVCLRGRRLVVRLSPGADPRRLVAGWYRREAERLIKSRVEFYAGLMGEAPARVAVKDQKRRWGSCSARRASLNFNFRLVMAPPPVIDYVVVHELAHLSRPDHSAAFWRCVAQFVPDFKCHRRWLREYGDGLCL